MSRSTPSRRDQLDLFVARPAYVRPVVEAFDGVADVPDEDAQVAVLTEDVERETPQPRLPDSEARRRIEGDLDTNLLVEAGAGAGKTTAMVGRMVALVRSGTARIEQIAAVTFTRKAAAELRERFQTALETALRDARVDGDQGMAARTDAALREIDRAFVGTIHSFCARLLRERPLDAGVDPGFRELMASEEKRLRLEYWSTHVERLAAEGDESLARLAGVGLRPAQLRTLFEKLTDYADVTFPAEPVPRPDPSEAKRQLEALLDEAESLMPLEEPDAGWDELQTAIRTAWFYRRLGWEDEVRFLDALAQAFSTPNRITIVRWGEHQEQRTAAKALSDRFSHFAGDQGAGGRVLSQWYAHRYPIAVAFAERAAQDYAAHRKRLGVLSFQDLLMLTAGLLRSGADARAELGGRYRFLLVDEFQDTDPVQAEVLFLLAAAEPTEDWRAASPRPGSLFVVGDPKQSIYRFRRADITLYNQVKDRFRAFGAVLELTSNFRSGPPIERFVNDTFHRRFPPEPTAMQAPFAPMRVVRRFAEPQGVFFYTVTKSSRRDLDEVLAAQDANRVASWIAARVASGERSPGDFMVLTRRKKHLSAYARAIEARNLPVQVTGAGIGIEQELTELKLLLSALADPGDARLTIAVLVGLFFGLDYEQLAEHAVDREGRFDFTNPPRESSPVADALTTLHRFWMLARTEPSDVVVARMVEELGLLPYAAAGELADSRAGALLYVLESLRSAALEGDASLTGALAALEAALDTEEAEAPLEPGRRDTVRLMNLHQAKGLESPVVVLAEPFGDWSPPPSLHVDRSVEGKPSAWLVVTERGRKWGDTVLARPPGWAELAAIEEEFDAAERDRLLYVAATRAEDELVVGSYDKDERSPWRGFFPRLFMEWPRLELGIAEAPERARLEAPGAEMEEAVQRVDADRRSRAERTYYAAPVRRRVHADSEVDTQPVADAAEQRRGRGPEWGTAVHGALEAAGRGQRGEPLRAVCRANLIAANREADASGEPTELDELVKLTETVVSSGIWTRAEAARASGGLLVEAPFALRLSREDYASMVSPLRAVVADIDAAPVHMVDGVIDLVFRDAEGWVVVDYKSDVGGAAIGADRLERYRAQVALYAAAWERLTGEPVSERVILFTEDGSEVRW